MPSKNRKRGAQIGNMNALKHGLYSQKLSALNPAALDEVSNGNVVTEIHMIRTMLARHLQMRQAHPPKSPEETLTDLRVISFAVARLASLIRLARHLPPEDLPDSDDWMDNLLRDSLTEFPFDPNAPIQ